VRRKGGVQRILRRGIVQKQVNNQLHPEGDKTLVTKRKGLRKETNPGNQPKPPSVKTSGDKNRKSVFQSSDKGRGNRGSKTPGGEPRAFPAISIQKGRGGCFGGSHEKKKNPNNWVFHEIGPPQAAGPWLRLQWWCRKGFLKVKASCGGKEPGVRT